MHMNELHTSTHLDIQRCQRRCCILPQRLWRLALGPCRLLGLILPNAAGGLQGGRVAKEQVSWVMNKKHRQGSRWDRRCSEGAEQWRCSSSHKSRTSMPGSQCVCHTQNAAVSACLEALDDRRQLALLLNFFLQPLRLLKLLPPQLHTHAVGRPLQLRQLALQLSDIGLPGGERGVCCHRL